MAELARTQWAAIAHARWRLFINSLRTTRGGMEMAARIWVAFVFTMLGLAGAVGMGAATWYFLSHGRGEWVAALLWLLLAFWQIFPLATSAFGEQVDTTNLLRFPLSYPAYFGVRLAYGACDAATLASCLCLVGMTIGAGAARTALLPWAALVFALFAAFNTLLAQMIFAWLERWLAKRRTREFMVGIFLLLMISFQLIGPLTRRYRDSAQTPALMNFAHVALPYQRWLPPGLAARALTATLPGALAALAALAGFAVLTLGLLHLRLKAEFHGENLSEGVRAATAPTSVTSPVSRPRAEAPPGTVWLGGGAFLDPTWAVMLKELRYLLRSPAMYFTLAMPVVLMFIFTLQGGRSPRPGHIFHPGLGGLGFPVGIAYAVLMLSNLVYNAFGTDHAGVQMYYLAPVNMRQVVAGKNLTYALVLAVEAMVIYAAASLVGSPPALWLVELTLAGLVFAALVNFSVGNLLSLYMPRKMDLSRLGRQGGKTTSGLVALGVQAALALCIGAAVAAGWLSGRRAVATLITAGLAAIAAIGYRYALGRIPALALARRESLLATLCKE